MRCSTHRITVEPRCIPSASSSRYFWLPAASSSRPKMPGAIRPSITCSSSPWIRAFSLKCLTGGGSGPAIILLTGSGHTAHVYDDFAPKLTDCCHVYGITRRGYGASSLPASGYDDQRLSEDVFRAIEQAKIPSPVLVGHSMSGGEMTTLGRQHSDRIAGLVYLDALGDLEDEPPADPEWAALAQKIPPDLRPVPVCPPAAGRAFAAFRLSQACRLGFVVPIPEVQVCP